MGLLRFVSMGVGSYGCGRHGGHMGLTSFMSCSSRLVGGSILGYEIPISDVSSRVFFSPVGGGILGYEIPMSGGFAVVRANAVVQLLSRESM